ncbi:MaoC family dehydratase N-terminal domain-containing protein [Halococcus dombrowskii]|uniref:MaoC family dehydratase N-terminal domain-containing protein n=1 Tax=Halococcus dombrowskii TaxID=179637 RepID=A0AAV3SEI4_HALDO|nr:MaoC/PaaZ C-terminal domain-containing protein [Halococcus dombrowskii]UOO94065.1 MaoC family dehydratase N-terminal domain-containing protein [Halococcus dombrowskii]
MSTFESIDEGETSTTARRTVTEADVTNFAGVSGDFNHHHTDAERMANTEYGERIVHGAFVFSVMTGLLWQSRTPEQRDDVIAFYGVDALRFSAPTYIGDTIHVETEVLEKAEREHPRANGTIRYGVEVLDQNGETVLSCELLSLVR